MPEKTAETLEELDAVVDEAIMSEIRSEGTGLTYSLYLFFDSPDKPLDPREFLDFWASLSPAERVYYLDPTSRIEAERKLTPEEWAVVHSLAETVFKSDNLNWWERQNSE